MSNQKQHLSSFDRFGLVSGIIGLLADVIALSTIFVQLQSSQGVPQIGVVVWIVAALSIVYTTLVISIYARRFFTSKQRRPGYTVTVAGYATIERGARAVTMAVGISLCLVFATLFVVAEFSGGSLGQAFGIGSGLSVGITFFLVEGINKAAREIYSALDFEYQG